MPWSKRAANLMLFGCLLLGASPALAETAPANSGHLRATALVITYRAGQPVARGTGFLIDREEGLLITNCHVADEYCTAGVFFAEMAGGKLQTDFNYYLKSGTRIPGYVLAADRERDLALLHLKFVPGEAKELKLAGIQPAVSTKIRLVGNPARSPTLWVQADGFVSKLNIPEVTPMGMPRMTVKPGLNIEFSVEKPQRLKLTGKFLETIFPEAQIGPGASGSAVANDKGELVGVLSSGINVPAGSLLNCVDVTEVRRFVYRSVLNFADAQVALGNDEKAVNYFTKALYYRPDDLSATLGRANAYSRQGQYAKAVTDCTTAIKAEPNWTPSYRVRGTAQLRLKNYKEAISDWGEVIKLNPKDALAYNERGVAHSFLDKYDLAIADYSKAIELDPKLARGYRNRASAHYFKGDYEKAIADCTEAVTIDPKYAVAYLARSRAYGKLNKAEEAKVDYAKAVELDPSLKK